MKHKDLPFQDWGRKAIATKTKTLTSRCSGLTEINRRPDEWRVIFQFLLTGGEYRVVFQNAEGKRRAIACPWQVGVDYDGVTVTGIAVKRLQNMTEQEAMAEGITASDEDNYPFRSAFASIWDSIHRRDVNNRYERNPWTWRLSISPTTKKE